MTDRKFFGKPMRDISLHYHPCKMSAGRFVHDIQESLVTFLENMRSLGIADEERYIEEWMETFLAWDEIEQDE